MYESRRCSSFLSLNVAVPAPRVHITSTPTVVYTTAHLNLTCITVLNPEVDTPMTVTHTWRGPSGSISSNSSRITVSTAIVGQIYSSYIFFHSGIQSSDAGSYYCTANASSTLSSSYIVASGPVLASRHISVGKGRFVYSLHLAHILYNNTAFNAPRMYVAGFCMYTGFIQNMQCNNNFTTCNINLEEGYT